MSSVRKTPISAKPIDFLRNLPENNHKIRRLFTDCFSAKFTLKIPAKLTDFSAILSPKIPRNLTFFSANYQKPCLIDRTFLCLVNALPGYWNLAHLRLLKLLLLIQLCKFGTTVHHWISLVIHLSAISLFLVANRNSNYFIHEIQTGAMCTSTKFSKLGTKLMFLGFVTRFPKV